MDPPRASELVSSPRGGSIPLGHADAALLMLAEKQEGRSRRITVGADKAYDTKDIVRTVRELIRLPQLMAQPPEILREQCA